MRLSKIYSSIKNYMYFHGDKDVIGINTNRQDEVDEYTFYLQDVHLKNSDKHSHLGSDFLTISDNMAKEDSNVKYHVVQGIKISDISFDKEEVLRKVDDMINDAVTKKKKKLYVCVSTKRIKYQRPVNTILWLLFCIFLVLVGRLQ